MQHVIYGIVRQAQKKRDDTRDAGDEWFKERVRNGAVSPGAVRNRGGMLFPWLSWPALRVRAATASDVAAPATVVEQSTLRAWHGNVLVLGVFVFAGYYLGTRLGLALTFMPNPISVLWPPNAILFAALLLTPR